MRAKTKFAGIWRCLLTVACTGVLLWFGTGLQPWWPLLWFAPLPVLLYAMRSSWRGTAVVAILSWAAGGMNLWWVFVHELELPVFVAASVVLIPAVVFALCVLLFRALVVREAYWWALVSFPAAWVSAEYLNNRTSVHGTFGNLAYSQLECLPLLQVASVTGPWGISFFLLLFSSTLAMGVYLWRTEPKLAVHVVFGGLGAVVLALILGGVRLAVPEHGPMVKVGLIASDAPGNRNIADAGADTERLFREYAAAADKAVGQGARALVIPEKVGVVVDPETRTTDAFFSALAEKTRAVIVVGMVRATAERGAQGRELYNEARVYAPGRAPLSYDKQHMLPPFESQLKPGTALTTMEETSGKWGVEICKDMDFTPLSREYGVLGTGLLLVPAWDFGVDRTLHGHMALMRGVESGFSMARAAKLGFLTVSDNRGRVLAESRSDAGGRFTTLVANVPVDHVQTLYLRFGDWFAWVTMAVLAGCLGRLSLTRAA